MPIIRLYRLLKLKRSFKTIPPAMSTKHRHWTETEKQKLFKDYFERLPGMCSACGRPVRMMTHHELGAVTLQLRCDCGNQASVTCCDTSLAGAKKPGEGPVVI